MTIPFPQTLQNLSEKFFPRISGKSPLPKISRRIGLNIGKANIVGCEVSVEGDRVTLERCGRIKISAEGSLSDQLQNFCKNAGFQSNKVRLSLKGQGVVIRFLQFPKMTREEFSSSIQYEAEKYLPFNLADVVLDYHFPVTQGDSGQKTVEVILVAVRKMEVDKMMALVKPTGLMVEAIDLDAFACVNALEYSVLEIKSQTVGMIDFGAGDTTLCICHLGHVVFSRDIAFGGNDMTELIRRKLNTTAEEAHRIQHEKTLEPPEHLLAVQEVLDRLFQEIKLSLNYYANQHPDAAQVQTLYVSGGFSQLAVLANSLQDKFQIPVKRWNPTEKMTLNSSISQEQLNDVISYLPVAVGLAIR